MAGNLQERLLVAEKPDPDSGVLDSSFTTNPHSYTPLRELADADRADEAAAAKSRCVKQPYCGGAVKLWCLRSTQDRVLLALTSALVFCLICATILPPIVNELTHEAVNSALVVDSPNSEAYDSWASNTQDDAPVLHYDFHIFDITNENEMLLEGAKPKLIEVSQPASQPVSLFVRAAYRSHTTNTTTSTPPPPPLSTTFHHFSPLFTTFHHFSPLFTTFHRPRRYGKQDSTVPIYTAEWLAQLVEKSDLRLRNGNHGLYFHYTEEVIDDLIEKMKR